MSDSLFDPTADREHPQPIFSTLLGALDHQQLTLLVPDGAMAGSESPDVEMAEVVVEAGEPLLRQLM